MKRQYRLLAAFITAVMLIGSMFSVVSAEEGNQTGAGTQQGGTIGGPGPGPKPPAPEPTPAPPTSNPNPAPPPSIPEPGGNGPTGGSQGGAGASSGQDSGLPPKQTQQPPSSNVVVDLIVVDISSQYLTAYDGGVEVLGTYVSTGKSGFDTPTGWFSIQYHLPVQDMEGVIGGEYYNVPSVPDVMYFTGVGHAFHGTYWHNNFGSPMSHGCVNIPLGTSAWLYNHTPNGTAVKIQW